MADPETPEALSWVGRGLLGLPTVTGENGSEACDARLVLKSGGVGGGGGRAGVLGPPHRPLHLPGLRRAAFSRSVRQGSSSKD